MGMKNFNVKQSGSEVILEEVNPNPLIIRTKRGNLKHYGYDNPAYEGFTPLILTSIDPNIKEGDVIREDQLEITTQKRAVYGSWLPIHDFQYNATVQQGYLTRQVAKLKQPVHETRKFNIGDSVIMINCEESKHYPNKVWRCRSDSFKENYGDKSEVVFLHGYAGYFLCEYLEKSHVHETPKSDLETCAEKEVHEMYAESEAIFIKSHVKPFSITDYQHEVLLSASEAKSIAEFILKNLQYVNRNV